MRAAVYGGFSHTVSFEKSRCVVKKFSSGVIYRFNLAWCFWAHPSNVNLRFAFASIHSITLMGVIPIPV